MDAILTSVLENAPQFGTGGIIMAVLIVVIRSATADKAEYREALSSAASRHKDEIARINADHDAELAELRDEIKKLRAQMDELNRAVDAERDRRRLAEDSEASARRSAGSVNFQPGASRHALEGETS